MTTGRINQISLLTTRGRGSLKARPSCCGGQKHFALSRFYPTFQFSPKRHAHASSPARTRAVVLLQRAHARGSGVCSRLVQFRFVESSLKRKIQAALSTSVSIDAHSFVRKGSRTQRTQSLRAELFTSLFLWLPCDETFPSRNESDQALRSQRELRLAESPTTVRVVPERARTTLFRGRQDARTFSQVAHGSQECTNVYQYRPFQHKFPLGENTSQ